MLCYTLFSGEESFLTSVTNVLILGVVSWLIYNERSKRYTVSKKEVGAVKEYLKFKKSMEECVNKLIKETDEIRNTIQGLEMQVNETNEKHFFQKEHIHNLLNTHDNELRQIKNAFDENIISEAWFIPNVLSNVKNHDKSLSDISLDSMSERN